MDNLQAQVNALSDQLNEIQLRSRAELYYYVQRIQELEMHATHAFEHVSEVQSYVEQKIATLEANLRIAETNLMEAYEEIARWQELYWDLRSRVIPVPVLTSHAEPQPPFHGAQSSMGRRGSQRHPNRRYHGSRSFYH